MITARDSQPDQTLLNDTLKASHYSKHQDGTIECCQVVVDSKDTLDLNHLSELANSLFQRYQRIADVADLDKAIQLLRQGIERIPNEQSSLLLAALGTYLSYRFHHTNELKDIDDAIQYLTQAIDRTPDNHPDRPSRLTSLGLSYLARFSRTPSHEDWASATTLLTEAAHTAPTLATVVHAAIRFIQRHYSSPETSSMKMRHDMFCMHALVIDLVSEVVWLGHDISRRYEEASGIGDAVSAAVAAALAVGYDWCALEWFEEGRAVVWGQILNLQSPIDELRRKHPTYAQRIEMLSAALKPSNGHDEVEEPNVELVNKVGCSTRRELAGEYKSVLADIRQLDGFKDFLRPRDTLKLADAALSGAVACINVDSARCDAIILQRASDGTPDVHFIPLPELSPFKVKEMNSTLNSYLRRQRVGRSREERAGAPVPFDEDGPDEGVIDVLESLWTCIVRPVVDSVAKRRTVDPSSHGLPRITWCTSGALTFLPLHAAGMYNDPSSSSRKAFNEFISSYTPTLTSLIPSTRADNKRSQLTTQSITIVAQPATPGKVRLPGTLQEARAVQKHFPSGGTHTLLQGTVDSVLAAMARHPHIHLACHGTQDALDPLRSAFILHDGRLTLGDLMAHARAGCGGGVAFLSACETAVGDARAPNEVVHLAAGMMLAAGYRSVVGTMWAIGDEDAPVVADAFYRMLRLEEDGDVDVAFALHQAVGILRDRVGEHSFVKWIPFVHYGSCAPLVCMV